ncbi:PDDEXK nuclease domain-containing protein [Mucilaginibacter sp.]|uniref:PDDEXK nuclease domain-containing protein n=1 Tax=Mucilaginibacter sp. TaxID=1882438 RepID=UPI0025F49768|nr:PDDEXK nuclease domain-containing protein [Mucilaginibacter sp.]
MTDYIEEIKTILLQARQKAYTTVNTAMVEAYWMIGKRIVDQEQHGENRAAYGENILKELSKSLTGTFGKGFSYSNLYNFRQFYLTYSEHDKFYTLCRKLTWSHNRLIMRVENIEARNYYLTEAAEQNWSVRTLERNIETFYYHRILSSGKISNELKLNLANEQQQPEDFIKDPYIFEFLNIQQPIDVKESAIETALIENLQQFLLELGKGFSFIGRQYRISTETDHFYIDLVFYNYLLKCFVLIDLKAGKLSHQHIGQMDMYRRLFDDLKKPEGDNPTIGIILCTEKSETVVKYSVINDNPRLFATKYMPYLPTEAELIAEIEREKLKLNFSNQDNKINNN